MQKYKVTINNKVYEVEIEKVDDNTTKEISTSNSTTDNLVGNIFNSPIQGNVLSVAVSPNQAVKKGDTLFIIEAMKLENEIVSDQDGVVSEVLVNVGATVDSNQPLLKFRG